jgi:hypothetical protein
MNEYLMVTLTISPNKYYTVKRIKELIDTNYVESFSKGDGIFLEDGEHLGNIAQIKVNVYPKESA